MHFKNIILILWIYRLVSTIFRRVDSILQVIHFIRLIKFIKLLYIHVKRLSESSLNTSTKPFSFLSHCKVSCHSPCCTNIFGDEDNHCICNIDTHECISDSDGEHIEKQ